MAQRPHRKPRRVLFGAIAFSLIAFSSVPFACSWRIILGNADSVNVKVTVGGQKFDAQIRFK